MLVPNLARFDYCRLLVIFRNGWIESERRLWLGGTVGRDLPHRNGRQLIHVRTSLASAMWRHHAVDVLRLCDLCFFVVIPSLALDEVERVETGCLTRGRHRTGSRLACNSRRAVQAGLRRPTRHCVPMVRGPRKRQFCWLVCNGRTDWDGT